MKKHCFHIFFLISLYPIYLVPLCQGDLIIIEPWTIFEVVNSGIQRPEEKTSIVPLKMLNTELIYEKEIVPNISTHIIITIREGIDDICLVKRMLDMLILHPFDTERILIYLFHWCLSFLNHYFTPFRVNIISN